jgi:hypothetical protein
MKRRDFSVPKGSSKLVLERHALLMQLGGYAFKGSERLYSVSGRKHLEAVTERKARAARMAAAEVRN